MKKIKKYLAFDIGASNGRVVVGFFDGKKIDFKDIYRFSNEPVYLKNGLYWNFLQLFNEIKNGLKYYKKAYLNDLSGIGIDTWGVDYGILDKDGNLIGNPYHYRDKRTEGIDNEISEILGGYEIYKKTGAKIHQISTICQLYSMVKSDSSLMKVSDKMLLMPSLFNYFLCGEKFLEHSNITPTCLYDIQKEKVAVEFLEKLKIPIHIIGKVIEAGTVIGRIFPEISKETGMGKVPVIIPAAHDTASAEIAVPADKNKKWAFLSCGTWAVIGLETKTPLISEEAYIGGITNASTADGRFMTIMNMAGLWVLQGCKKIWDKAKIIEYKEMVEMAEKGKSFSFFIDTDDPAFINPENMLEAINVYCKKTSQNMPANKEDIIRGIIESLAFKYKLSLQKIENVSKEKFEILHIVGGGAKNSLLSQFTANSVGIPVLAGPLEATSVGNIIMQMIGDKTISSIEEGRNIIRESMNLIEFCPQNTEIWEDIFNKYKKITGGIK